MDYNYNPLIKSRPQGQRMRFIGFVIQPRYDVMK
jgi:hypothetical protein